MDGKNRPVGSGCEVCVLAVTRGACYSWEEGMKVYHDTTNPENSKIVAIVDACCSTLLEQEKGHDVQFTPPSTVDSQKKQGIMNYVEVAFLSEADLVRFTSLGIKALGLTPVTRENEDGSGTTQGVYCSFKDMDIEIPEMLSLRRSRFWSEVGLALLVSWWWFIIVVPLVVIMSHR